MDKVNKTTAKQHPELLELRQCKSKGMSTGLATLIFVGAGSYILLKIPAVGRTIPNRYHTLLILGGALSSGYITSAYTTKKCYKTLHGKL